LSDSGHADGIFFIRFGSLHAILQQDCSPRTNRGAFVTKMLVNTGQSVNTAEENKIVPAPAFFDFVHNASAAIIE